MMNFLPDAIETEMTSFLFILNLHTLIVIYQLIVVLFCIHPYNNVNVFSALLICGFAKNRLTLSFKTFFERYQHLAENNFVTYEQITNDDNYCQLDFDSKKCLTMTKS